MADPNPPAAAGPLAHRVDFSPLFPIEAWEPGAVEELCATFPDAATASRNIYAVARRASEIIWDREDGHHSSFHHILESLFTQRVLGDRGRAIFELTMFDTLDRMSLPDSGGDDQPVRDAALYLAARLTEHEIAYLRKRAESLLASGRSGRHAQQRLQGALSALQTEETRRANRARYLADGRDRGVMLQADLGVFADRMPGGRDVFNHVIAPMVSGFVTSHRDPTRPTTTGPLPSNRDRLAQLVADAQVAAHAAAAHPEQAPNLLIGVARSIAELNDSVQESNKRHKH